MNENFCCCIVWYDVESVKLGYIVFKHILYDAQAYIYCKTYAYDVYLYKILYTLKYNVPLYDINNICGKCYTYVGSYNLATFAIGCMDASINGMVGK